jgi:hypothetical protein
LALTSTCFAHADLAEVVEQRGVLELAQIVGVKAGRLVGAGVGALDGLGEAHGQLRDAQRVAARRRVALLDRLDAGAHEALEACARISS